MSDRVTRDLVELRANITGLDPNHLLEEFIAKCGPDWEDRDLYALFELVKEQNHQIVEIKKLLTVFYGELGKIHANSR